MYIGLEPVGKEDSKAGKCGGFPKPCQRSAVPQQSIHGEFGYSYHRDNPGPCVDFLLTSVVDIGGIGCLAFVSFLRHLPQNRLRPLQGAECLSPSSVDGFR
jgi:hypothetical protein